VEPGTAGSTQLSGRSGTFGGGTRDPASPVSVAARIRNRSHPGAAWGASSGMIPGTGNDRHIDGAPAVDGGADPDDVLAPGRRITSRGSVSGGVAGAGRSGSAPMGGRTNRKDVWGDGMINEEDRGSAHDL
jgi:hypothetical protein